MKGISKFFSVENVVIVLLVLVLVILFIRKTRSGYTSGSPFTITATFTAPVSYTTPITGVRVIVYSCTGGASGCGPLSPNMKESDISNGIIPVSNQKVKVTGPDSGGKYTCNLMITDEIIKKGIFVAGNTMQFGLAVDPTPIVPDSFGEFAFVKFLYNPTVITPTARTTVKSAVPTTPAKPGPVMGLAVLLK